MIKVPMKLSNYNPQLYLNATSILPTSMLHVCTKNSYLPIIPFDRTMKTVNNT